MPSFPEGNPIEALPPFSPEAEEAVLGSCLLDPEAINLIGFLHPEHFFREDNRLLFAALVRVGSSGAPVDLLTVSNAMKELGSYDRCGGLLRLSHLVSVVPTALHVEHYAHIVADMANRRRMISSAGKIAQMAYDTSRGLDSTVAESMNLMAAVGQNATRFTILDEEEWMGRMLQRVMEAVEDDPDSRPVSTGIRTLDKHLGGGMMAGKMIILAGRPGQGKTALAESIIRGVARKEDVWGPARRVLWISPEMDEDDLGDREVSARAREDFRDFMLRARQGATLPYEPELFGAAIQGMTGAPVALVTSPYITTADVRLAYIQAQARWGDVGFIVVDHIGLLQDLKGREESEPQRLGRISKVLRGMAKEFRLPILVLSQLNRNAESRDNGLPSLGDLRESGHLEQDADVVILLWRKDHYLRMAGKEVDPAEEDVATLILAKNRQGLGGGTVRLKWLPHIQTFRDLTPPEATAFELLAASRGSRA